MNSYYIYLLIPFSIILVLKILLSKPKTRNADTKTIYQYKKKDFLINKNEHEFFDILISILEDKYHLFPQLHLDSFLNSDIDNQNTFGAHAHIRLWSVDYVICDKNYIKPLLAIELDGSSHKHDKKVRRDEEVERILKEANLPLLRFNNNQGFDKEKVRNRIFAVLNKKQRH